MSEVAPAVVALRLLAGSARPRRAGDLVVVVLAIATAALADRRGLGSGAVQRVRTSLSASRSSTAGFPRLVAALAETHAGRVLDPSRALTTPPPDVVLADVLDRLTPEGNDLDWLGDVLESLLAVEVSRADEPTRVLRAAGRAGDPGADAAVGLTTLLAVRPALRGEMLREAGAALTKRVAALVRAAGDLDSLAAALGSLASPLEPEVVPAGRRYVHGASHRRRAGAHFTPAPLADDLVRRTLAPLLGDRPSSTRILSLEVCDPAMGTGAILLAACRYLVAALREALAREGRAIDEPELRLQIVERCLRGVDRQPFAVELARLTLWLEIGSRGVPVSVADGALLVGDALLAPLGGDEREGRTLSWRRDFPTVGGRGGFDAIVGNPPWVSWAGRGAQPLDGEVRALYAERFRAFAGFRSAQALFIERGATLVLPGGRVGLLLPSSMSEQHGYAPARRAHDRLAACDDVLPDVGDAFRGVFQPCMMLLSTRRASPIEPGDGPWPVERRELDELDLRILAKLDGAPVPRALFGERGLQTSGDDRAHLRPERDAKHDVPLRSGSDVDTARLSPPSTFADRAWFGQRLRRVDWADVKIVIRQTARYPVAAASDGVAFRNSLLAGFEDDEHPVQAMVAYLCSTPIRFRHWASHRDARQGIPQVKIAHLRGIPSPGRDLVTSLLRASDDTPAAIARVDALVAARFGLSDRELAHVVARLLAIG